MQNVSKLLWSSNHFIRLLKYRVAENVWFSKQAE